MDNSHLYGEALSEAGRWVVRHPKLTHILDNRDPVATAMLNTFIRQPAVWAYLRTLRVTRHRETAQQLLDKAHARIHGGGQTSAIVSLYRSYDAGGRLTDLSPSQFAVLRTTFGLAIANGPTVLASLRYLAVAVESETGIRITPSRMRRVLMRLIALGLIEYEPGRRGYTQHPLTRSGRVNLANLLPPIAWTLFQVMTLLLESFAPLWFSWSRTRPYALIAAVSMHAMIGLMFGPVRYFAMLMATLLIASHLSERRLEQLTHRLAKLTSA